MNEPEIMAEVWRGNVFESRHRGHAVICNPSGDILASWGDPDTVILPRSSCKMLQALPLIESGAADRHGLTSEQLALSCASHQGAPIHTDRVTRWLADLGLGNYDLRCGPQLPPDVDTRIALTLAGETPCRYHNNCSGKHSGFLTLNKHLGAGPEYVQLDHPVQVAVKAAFEEMCGQDSLGYGIDGCSAPNFATRLSGLARAMARMAAPSGLGATRAAAADRLVSAMAKHPELVAGSGRACTEIMQAVNGRAVVKTGAEAVFVAILPERGLGVAVKIEDGGTRGAECAIAALLVRLGAADPNHPMIAKRLNPPVKNWDGLETGFIRASEALYQNGAAI